MTHPNDATLALHAGNDLGWLACRRTGRHLARCERCRREVDAYIELRAELPTLAELPGLGWNRLAAEMRANIRLGLAAGACVRSGQETEPAAISWFGTRALVTYASIAALLGASVLLERPAPRPRVLAADAIVLQSVAGGIEMREGGRALSLMHRRGADVTYSVSAQGAMRARYVDADTGTVTINNVYAQ